MEAEASVLFAERRKGEGSLASSVALKGLG